MKPTTKITYIIITIIIGFVLVVGSVSLFTPHQKSDDELNILIESIRVPIPTGVNYTGFEGSWTTASKRNGQCIYFSLFFGYNNPSWSIVSFHRTDPKTGIVTSHMVNMKGNIVFDPVLAVFFDKEGYFQYFDGKDMVEYQY